MILHRFYFNLNQSDKKSDQPGILGPGRSLKIFEYLQIIWVEKSEKTFKMSFWADFGRESEKTLTLK